MSDKVETKEVTKEAVHHEVGDLTLICGQCGNNEVLQEDIPGGISFILATIEGAEVKMVCGKCGNEINLTFTNMSDDRDVEYRLKKEEMEEALKQEQEAAVAAAKEAELEQVKNEEVSEDEAAELAEAEAEFLEVQAETPEEEVGEATDEDAGAESEEDDGVIEKDAEPDREMITL